MGWQAEVKMKFGFMQVYNEAIWIGYAIEQAMVLCDKLLVVEGSQFISFPDISERSDDGTLDIISDKAKEYGSRIIWINTIGKHANYRKNQCANFNRGLTYCKMGDYFINLDADEFYFDEFIAEANELMREEKADFIKSIGYTFAFSFKWSIDFGCNSPNPFIVKKIEGFHFIPTHKWIGHGKNIMTIPLKGRHHYAWVKLRERILLRMRTSERYPDMEGWFNKYWDNFMLEDGREYPCYAGKFTLHRYEGKHPAILDNHPWKDVEDIRKL